MKKRPACLSHAYLARLKSRDATIKRTHIADGIAVADFGCGENLKRKYLARPYKKLGIGGKLRRKSRSKVPTKFLRLVKPMKEKLFYEFSPFLLDPGQRVLLRAGERVPLHPKTFLLLQTLVEANGQVVSKDELLAKVWPDVVVEETNLTKNISLLRRALGNGAESGEFIETIPKVGYRFCAAVLTTHAENGFRKDALGAAAPMSAAPVVSPAENKTADVARGRVDGKLVGRRWLWVGLAVAIVVGAAAWRKWPRPQIAQLAANEFAPVRLTNHIARDLYPAYSPDGKKIAFSSNRDGLPAIYVMNADGGDVRKISGAALNCGWPKWSADGKKILFSAQLKANGLYATYEVNAEGGGLTKFSNSWGKPSPDGKKIALVRSLSPGVQGSGEIFVANADGSGEVRLTKNDRLDADPAWSPDGGRIAFSCFPDGFVEGKWNNPEICVMNADGSDTIRLTNDPAWDNTPIWSPDGTRIAFHSSRDCKGGEAIYVMNADGSNQMRLTECQNFEGEGVWSPDSKQFVYASHRDGNLELYAINADPSHQTNLTKNVAEDTEPVWSRDGKKIAFLSNRDGKDSLFVMDADGSKQRRLVNDIVSRASWSPDGRRIAFAATWAGNVDVYVANADGSGIVRLTHSPTNENSPVWSLDGAKILFCNQVDQTTQLFVMNADGSRVIRISHSPEHEWQHDWSPDGQQIVFTRSRNRGVQRDIWLMNADSSNPHLIAFAPGNDEFLLPRFSPDGQRIAFHRRVASPLQADVWVMNADGSGQTRLTHLGGGVPAWSPDGKRLAFQSHKRTGNSEIYVMDVAGK